MADQRNPPIPRKGRATAFPFLSRARLGQYKDFLADFTDAQGNRYFYLQTRLMSGNEIDILHEFLSNLAIDADVLLVRLASSETMLNSDQEYNLIARGGNRVTVSIKDVLTQRARSKTCYALVEF
jgi:hypothetical protein